VVRREQHAGDHPGRVDDFGGPGIRPIGSAGTGSARLGGGGWPRHRCRLPGQGPAGLFPLAAPVIATACFRNNLSAVRRSGAIMIGAAATATILLLWPQAPRGALKAYWSQNLARR